MLIWQRFFSQEKKRTLKKINKNKNLCEYKWSRAGLDFSHVIRSTTVLCPLERGHWFSTELQGRHLLLKVATCSFTFSFPLAETHLCSMKTQCGRAVLKQKDVCAWPAEDHWNCHVLLCSLYGIILTRSVDCIPSSIASVFYCKTLSI